ncbi:MAG: SH3 domain-containing protein, partial [Salegentibacter mishustinae]|nr:SH3 domain-containing protein [Salegentibacter mishustinae]
AINPLHFVYQTNVLETEPEKLDSIPHKLIVQNTRANLRNKPTTSNSKILSTSESQDTLQFLGKTNEWFHVRNPENKAYFIHQSLVTPI